MPRSSSSHWQHHMLINWRHKHPGCDSLLSNMATTVIYIRPQAPVTVHTIDSSTVPGSELWANDNALPSCGCLAMTWKWRSTGICEDVNLSSHLEHGEHVMQQLDIDCTVMYSSWSTNMLVHVCMRSVTHTTDLQHGKYIAAVAQLCSGAIRLCRTTTSNSAAGALEKQAQLC